MRKRGPTPLSTLKLRKLGVVVILLALPSPLWAQGSSEQFWPSATLSLQLGKRAGMHLTWEKQNSEDISSTERKFSVIGTYRARRIVSILDENIDQEKNYNLVLGAGYEYLDSNDAGNIKRENRLLIQATPGHAFSRVKLFVQDRNRVEFRWVNGSYSTRYRNKLTVERPLKLKRLPITVYTSGELFHDGKQKSWNKNQYSFGAIWPYKKLLSIDTYYTRQNCTTCDEAHVNAIGLTVTVFWRLKK